MNNGNVEREFVELFLIFLNFRVLFKAKQGRAGKARKMKKSLQ